MGEAHLLPWSDQWSRNIADLKQRFGELVSRLDSVGGDLRELSSVMNGLYNQFGELSNLRLGDKLQPVYISLQKIEQGNLRLDDRLGKVHSSSQQIEQHISRLREALSPLSIPVRAQGSASRIAPTTAVDRDASNALKRLRPMNKSLSDLAQQVASANSETKQLSASLSHSIAVLDDINASLSSLDQSSHNAAGKFADDEQRINQALADMRRLAEQATRIIGIVNEDLQRRAAALADYENKIQKIENDYAQQVEEARARDLAQQKAVEEVQRSAAWLTWQPEALISELTGVDKGSIEELAAITPQMRSRIWSDHEYRKHLTAGASPCPKVASLA